MTRPTPPNWKDVGLLVQAPSESHSHDELVELAEAFLRDPDHLWPLARDIIPELLEAAAVATERARLRLAILGAGMFQSCGGEGCTEERNDELAAVLALLD